jgi:hypothetical protein
MVKYITARHHGESDTYYQRGRTYPLALKVRFFSKKVEIYKRHGYYDEMDPGSHRVFADMDSFDKVWGEVREDRHGN